MFDVYAAADLIVCRAGATSVAEIAQTGAPSVLVPLPGAPGDHQTKNAQALSDHDAALLVPDDQIDGPKLIELISDLVDAADRLAQISANAVAQARPDAAAAIADLIETHASEQ